MVGDNYLSAEGLIIQRLQDQIPELAFVGGSRSVKEVIERAFPTPSALVVWAGDTIKDGSGQSAARGATQVISQKWHVELIVNNQWNASSGEGERLEAGVLIKKAIAALAGWSPSEDHCEMKRVQSAQPQYDDGLAYFPLSFTTELIT